MSEPKFKVGEEVLDYLKASLVVLIILGAMIYCDTDEFEHRCLAGDKEFCVEVRR